MHEERPRLATFEDGLRGGRPSAPNDAGRRGGGESGRAWSLAAAIAVSAPGSRLEVALSAVDGAGRGAGILRSVWHPRRSAVARAAQVPPPLPSNVMVFWLDQDTPVYFVTGPGEDGVHPMKRFLFPSLTVVVLAARPAGSPGSAAERGGPESPDVLPPAGRASGPGAGPVGARGPRDGRAQSAPANRPPTC